MTVTYEVTVSALRMDSAYREYEMGAIEGQRRARIATRSRPRTAQASRWERCARRHSSTLETTERATNSEAEPHDRKCRAPEFVSRRRMAGFTPVSAAYVWERTSMRPKPPTVSIEDRICR